MINLKACRKTPTINVGVNPVTNVHLSNNGTHQCETTVRYPPSATQDIPSMDEPLPEGQAAPCNARPSNASVSVAPHPSSGPAPGFVNVNPHAVNSFTADMSAFQSDDPDKAKLLRENAVLKLIIDIQHSNPMIVNKYIIADDEKLIQMIALLCNASEVHIDADDVGRGCISKNTYRKVHSIYVVVNGETKNLKYDFSDVMYTLKELHISTKYVW